MDYRNPESQICNSVPHKDPKNLFPSFPFSAPFLSLGKGKEKWLPKDAPKWEDVLPGHSYTGPKSLRPEAIWTLKHKSERLTLSWRIIGNKIILNEYIVCARYSTELELIIQVKVLTHTTSAHNRPADQHCDTWGSLRVLRPFLGFHRIKTICIIIRCFCFFHSHSLMSIQWSFPKAV